jgi:hypothetical protein
MAKYAPSALIGRISRSAGSTTFGHNRFGAYFRNRVIPTNPVSPAQTAVRVDFGDHSSNYRSLTQPQRDEWIAYGLNYAKTDSLGQGYTLTGLQAYVSVARNRATYGAAALSVPDLFSPPSGLASAEATAEEATTLSVAFSVSPLPAGAKVAIFATRPLSAGINFQPNGAYKLISVSGAAAASPLDIKTPYEVIFGSVGNEGDKILFKAVVLNASGLASPWLQFSVIVAGP